MVAFFTPVAYGKPVTFEDSFLEIADNYFYYGGEKATVYKTHTKDGKEKVFLTNATTTFLEKFFKVISLPLFGIPLMLAKGLLRSRHDFKVVNIEQKLGKNLTLPEDLKTKLRSLTNKIFDQGYPRNDDEELKWLGLGNTLIFQLKEYPELVFKTSRFNCKYIAKLQLLNMIKAKKVSLINKLNLLVIPKAKLLTLNADERTFTFLVEERPQFNSDASIQEELYHLHARELTSAVKQLALFIAKTGFNDAIFRNIPIIEDDLKKPKRIALIDLEHMSGAIDGMVGPKGFIRCLEQPLIQIALTEFKLHSSADIPDLQESKVMQERLKIVESNNRLRSFHAQKGFVTGKEPLVVDIKALGLDLEMSEECDIRFKEQTEWSLQKVFLRKVTEDIIENLNEQIQKSDDNASLKGKRTLGLIFPCDPFSSYKDLGLPERIITEENKHKLWTIQILQALVDKGHIFKFTGTYNRYTINA